MTAIPRPALVLGLAGVVPFALPVLGSWIWPSAAFDQPWEFIQFAYGLTILSFMSGCIWAFAAKTNDAMGYGLSTAPALLGFALILAIQLGYASPSECLVLIAIGFLALLFLDRRATRLGQTPPWWMRWESSQWVWVAWKPKV